MKKITGCCKKCYMLSERDVVDYGRKWSYICFHTYFGNIDIENIDKVLKAEGIIKTESFWECCNPMCKCHHRD